MSRSFKKIPTVSYSKGKSWCKRQWVTNWRHHANRKLRSTIDLEAYQDISVDQMSNVHCLSFNDIFFLFYSKGNLKKDLKNINGEYFTDYNKLFSKPYTSNGEKRYKRSVHKYWGK